MVGQVLAFGTRRWKQRFRTADGPFRNNSARGAKMYLDKKNPYIRRLILSPVAPTWGYHGGNFYVS